MSKVWASDVYYNARCEAVVTDCDSVWVDVSSHIDGARGEGARRVLDQVGNEDDCRDCGERIWFVRVTRPGRSKAGCLKWVWWVFNADGSRHECGVRRD